MVTLPRGVPGLPTPRGASSRARPRFSRRPARCPRGRSSASSPWFPPGLSRAIPRSSPAAPAFPGGLPRHVPAPLPAPPGLFRALPGSSGASHAAPRALPRRLQSTPPAIRERSTGGLGTVPGRSAGGSRAVCGPSADGPRPVCGRSVASRRPPVRRRRVAACSIKGSRGRVLHSSGADPASTPWGPRSCPESVHKQHLRRTVVGGQPPVELWLSGLHRLWRTKRAGRAPGCCPPPAHRPRRVVHRVSTPLSTVRQRDTPVHQGV